MEFPAMARAFQDAIVKSSRGERPKGMRTHIVEGMDTVAGAYNHNL
jgi:hypothetical protein